MLVYFYAKLDVGFLWSFMLFFSLISIYLVLLGDVGAGKSSLVLRFIKGQFIEFQVGINNRGCLFFTNIGCNGAIVKFGIWDTAGQERYHSLAPIYYRGAAAAIIVYDITNQTSFERAKKWVQELQSQGNPNMVMALAGNKADLLEARKEAQAYAQENGLFFMETSAKTASNVNDIFYEIELVHACFVLVMSSWSEMLVKNVFLI
ncbi:hypothetical protein FEM48_Zijuj08G0201200 [Ziziphus jujuba var. spinosa]|uniref:Uncharacterized protein n=1 Tax=Ziziphus jujuba var. spinosa TaxID=714518 RepID=A0A978V145_ZIZJJ|nr:hypothetical protein FEM48_Zijuj08G0201200 [Ziziphus jujuba var. spinosa]